MKERKEGDEEREKELIVGGSLLDTIHLLNPTILLFFKQDQRVKINNLIRSMVDHLLHPVSNVGNKKKHIN